MPTYNKPGVYVEESLTPAAPVVATPTTGVSVFIGVSDRGPTTGSANNVVGVPTLVTSWADFYTKFNFGDADDVWNASYSGTTSADLRYAVYSFFRNGGSQAYILRNPFKDSVKASSTFYTRGSSVTNSVAATAAVTATQITFTLASGNSALSASNSATLVSISGFAETGLNKVWPVSTVNSSTSFVIDATTGIAVSTYTAATATVVVTPIASTTPNFTISAKDHGAWGNKIWVKTEKGSYGDSYMDISVYYNGPSLAGSVLNSNNDYRVEYWPNVSLNPSDTAYGPTYIQSSWIDFATTATTAATPYATYYANTDGSVTAGPVALGTATNAIRSGLGAGTQGSDGSTSSTWDVTAAQLDPVVGPLTVNAPGVTATDNVSSLLTYAAGRGDAFIVIDPSSDTLSTVTTAAKDYGDTNTNSYGAVYFPRVNIPDPAAKDNSTKSIQPGGAVLGAFAASDTSRGVFKAPAGTSVSLSPLVVSAVTTLSNAEFTTLSTSNPQVNVIRYVPGAGFCIMGARTVSQKFNTSRFVPVRRTLNYLKRNLTDQIAFALFEPNGSLLWSQVASTLDSFLYSFWRQGGLQGTTAEDAYYVKCDATTNTAAAQAAGELRVEVGVALQSPAEFIIIKLGQYQGGTTVTTTV